MLQVNLGIKYSVQYKKMNINFEICWRLKLVLVHGVIILQFLSDV